MLAKVKMTLVMAIVLAGAALALAGPTNLVKDGTFDAFDNWTTNNVPPGQASGLDTVDIDGSGPLGDSAAFYAYPGGYLPGGSVYLEQTITNIVAGTTYKFCADLASFPSNTNADGGLVTARMAGNVIATYNFGDIDYGMPEYGSLSGTFTPGKGGNYLLSIEFHRTYGASTSTPMLCIDNVALCTDAPTVPAPGALLLGSLGSVVVGLVRRKRLA